MRVGHDTPLIIQLQAGNQTQKFRLLGLASGLNNHIARLDKLGAGDFVHFAISSRGANKFHARNVAVTDNFDWCHIEQTLYPYPFGQVILEIIRAHVLLTPAIRQNHIIGPQARRFRGRVHGGIATAKHNHLAAHGHRVMMLAQFRNKFYRTGTIYFVLARQAQLVGFPQANAEENSVVFIF